jgi:glycosyltransferase involved in cell wall biosynthesis
VSEQDYPGPLRVVVVHDDVTPDWRLASGGERPVLVLENWRTPGVAGARNTGILAAGDCELVALCDDDDTWAPGKLTAQVSALRGRPGAAFATCAAEVEYDGRRTPRLAGRHEFTVDRLTGAGRKLSASGFVARHDALTTEPSRGGIGLLSEHGNTVGEEWDLLMRAARRSPIVHVDLPLVRVLWRPAAVDPTACEGRVRALHWMMDRHPELRRRAPRLYAEIACWQAAAGNRWAARESAGVAVRTGWYEPWTAVAVAAASGALRPRRLRLLLRRYLLP